MIVTDRMEQDRQAVQEDPGHPSNRTGASGPVNGILVIDKPEGVSSFGVVSRVRKILDIKKVGHCGTLDPFATGVLVLCLNHATRIAEQLLDQEKVYRFKLHLGIETDTQDCTGQVVRCYEGPACTREAVEQALEPFKGSFIQTVPRFAAVKIQGRRLYKLTRSGIEVELPSREVHILRLEMLSFEWPHALIEVHCSKGTYIRQLATDIGAILGCGAHVSELRRLRSGPFEINQSIGLHELEALVRTHCWMERLIPMSEALRHLPAITLEDAERVRQVCNGLLEAVWEEEQRSLLPSCTLPVRLVTGDKRLVALWWPHIEAEHQRRLRVFHP